MVSAMGYKAAILPYHETKRVAGRDQIFAWKNVPPRHGCDLLVLAGALYIGMSAGVMFLCLAALEMVYVCSFWLTGETSTLAPGWSSLMFVILIASGSS